MINISTEIDFKTFRSGGKGGQNVNKVETAVEGTWNIRTSNLITPEQRVMLLQKLFNRINSEEILQVRSQTHRTQLGNKEEVRKKMQALIAKALKPKKIRIATKMPKAIKEKRLENKKRNSERKQERQKLRY